MSSEFELSDETQDKLQAVKQSSNLSDDCSPEKVIRTLCNSHLIQHGDTEELTNIREEKRETEAKRAALREWME